MATRSSSSEVLLPLRPLFRTPYDPSDSFPGLSCPEPSLAKQSDKEDADINVMMERFKVTGNLPVSPVSPTYGDFSQVSDYRSALHVLMDARDQFNALDAKLRARFGNDPASFIDFLNDPANRAEAEKLGLLTSAKPDVGGIGGAAPDAKPAGAPDA